MVRRFEDFVMVVMEVFMVDKHRLEIGLLLLASTGAGARSCLSRGELW